VAARARRPAASWLDDVLGPLTAQGVGEPRVSGRTDADLEDVLSLDCTVGHLLAQEGQAREALAPALGALDAMEMEVIRRSGLVAPGVDEDTARRTFRRLIAPARLRGVDEERMCSLLAVSNNTVYGMW